MSSYNDVNGKCNRTVDSSLPAVPFHAKSVTLNRVAKNSSSGKTFASCDDLREVPETFTNKQNNNNIMNPTGQSTFNMSYGNSKNPRNPNHEYEELTEQSRQIQSTSREQQINKPLNYSQTTTLVKGCNRNENQINQDKISTLRTSRERQNPMYAGYEPKRMCSESNESQSDGFYERKLNQKQRRVLIIVLIVLTILISLAALVTSLLFAFGVILNPQQQVFAENIDLKENLQKLELEAEKMNAQLLGKLKNVDQVIVDQNKTVDNIISSINNLTIANKILQKTREENNQSKSPDITQLQNLISEYESRITKLSEKNNFCRHETYSIGSSATQQFTESGEYYADKNFVITGVTCSSSNGYTSTLQSRIDEGKTKYKCTCHRNPDDIVVMYRSRVECRIHYWQCPN